MTPTLVIGEAWGVQEARTGTGLVGPSGVEFLRMADEAGLISLTAADTDFIREFYRTGDPAQIDMIWRLHPEIARTNVFNLHPPGNDLDHLCGTRAEGAAGWPALSSSKYLLPQYAPELDRLDAEINDHNPNLIIALGNTPLWALCGLTRISALRGSTRVATRIGAGRKVLPIYHPAAVLRDWSLRPLSIFDLTKAAREQEFSDVRRPSREFWIDPGIPDIERFIEQHIRGCPMLSTDIETAGTRVTCIGFAPRVDLAIVIPFDDDRKPRRSYWPTLEAEVRAWELVRGVLGDRSVPKLFQNGLYDIAFLWRSYGIPTMNAMDDTMLCHHALQPESQKGLGFLGSVYCDEGAWKTERKVATIKRED